MPTTWRPVSTFDRWEDCDRAGRQLREVYGAEGALATRYLLALPRPFACVRSGQA